MSAARAHRIAAKTPLLEAVYRNAIALNPNDIAAYFDLAGLLERHKGDLVGAQAAHADGYFTLAKLCVAKGNLQSAEFHFRTALSCQRKIGGDGEAAHAVRGNTAALAVEGNTAALAVEGNTAAPAAGGDVDPSATAENTIAAGQTSVRSEARATIALFSQQRAELVTLAVLLAQKGN